MSLLTSPTFISPARPNYMGTLASKWHLLASPGTALFISYDQGARCLVTEIRSGVLRRRHPAIPKSAAVVGSSQPDTDTDSAASVDWAEADQELDGADDLESPWEGAVIYRRNSLVSHVEYCTTLERLGLEKLSTDTSKSRAAAMGLRATKSVKDYPLGTPVQISIDVARRNNRKLRLGGIIRTVISLGCNSCGDTAAEPVYSNFSLLLTNEPIEEPEILNMGTVFGEDKSTGSKDEEVGEDAVDADIDMDDWLYFPPEEKEIDISKHIRDLVHLEITLNAVCSTNCKGLCLRCGTNLNTSKCSCGNAEMGKRDFGPLGNLRKKMQQQK